MSDHGLFLPTRATRSGERANSWGVFQGCTGLWTAGCCWLARRLHQLKASTTTMDLGIFSIFLISGTMCGLEKLGLVDQNWLEHNLSALSLRTLVVGRRQQSKSIEVALDME